MRGVFIGGCPRSGTTMLGALLGAHSRCITTPESQFKVELLSSCGDATDPAAVLNRIREHWRFRIWSMDLPADVRVPGNTGSAFSDAVDAVVRAYARQHGAPHSDVWIDHTPENIRHLRTLLELDPAAKVIHLVRDGRAVAASVMRLDWGPNTIIHAAQWWTSNVAFGLAAETTLADRVLRVRYEDLLLDTDATLRRINGFLDLEFEPGQLAGDGFDVPDFTGGHHALVGARPDTRGVERWRSTLQPRQVELFESQTGEFLTYLGYDLVHGPEATPFTRLEMLGAQLRELASTQIMNRFRFRQRYRRLVGPLRRRSTALPVTE